MITILKKLSPWIVIFIGSVIWVSIMWQSGQYYDYGVGFWGPHGHDAVWHLSLTNSLATDSYQLPMYAGKRLQNYHFGFDVMVATLIRFTPISSSTYYFQILPIFFSITIGFLVYYLTKNLWSVFLTYFATGLGWIIGKGESTFWAQQAISTLINPPYALSLIFLLLGFIYLRKKNYFLTAIFFGTVGFIKIYAGILGVITLLFISFPWFLIACILSLALFLPFNSLNNNTLVFEPFWFVKNLFSDPSRLYWPRMFNYLYSNNLLKTIPATLISLLIFFIGNFAIRIIGLFNIPKIFLPTILLGILFPVFFIQSGTTWNTIQFMYYSMFFLAIFAGEAIVKKFKNSMMISLIILILTLPAIPATLSHYLPGRPPASIPKSEVQALEFLKSQPAGIVLTPLYDKNNFSKFIEPRPLFAYESTAYVSAYSGHPVFLEDEVNLHILNIDIARRKAITSTIFTSNLPSVVRDLISQNNLKYIYLPDAELAKPEIDLTSIGFTQVFSSHNTQIWSLL